MAENSKIEWTDHTFNPWVGCTKISPACDHCYAESWAKRTGGAHLWQGERRRTTSSNWRQPFKWDRDAERAGVRRKVFCASLADVFDNQVPEEWRDDLWDLIYKTDHLDWLLLTKRPQNIHKMLPPEWGADGLLNVWLGTTVANQDEADRNIPHLLATPVVKRFLSCEPLLGPVSMERWWKENPPASTYWHGNGIHWIIVGGESGSGARPMHPHWARSLRDQCQAAGVPFFFKQWGEWGPAEKPTHWISRANGDARPVGQGVWASEAGMARIGKKAAGAMLDGCKWREMPA